MAHYILVIIEDENGSERIAQVQGISQNSPRNHTSYSVQLSNKDSIVVLDSKILSPEYLTDAMVKEYIK